MLFFNKLLPLFVLPIGWVALLIVLAAWEKKRWPLLVALGVLYFASIPFVSSRLIGWVESRYPALPVSEGGPADAIVVLGGILRSRVVVDAVPNLAETGERFEAGVALAQAQRAPLLVFTGAGLGFKEPVVTTEGAELKKLAVLRGVPDDRILVTSHVANTADEARVVAELAKARGWKRVILVTSGWHMPRSVHQFKRAGVDCLPYPVDFQRDATRKLSSLDFVPRGEAWQLTETALRETYGLWFYRIFR